MPVFQSDKFGALLLRFQVELPDTISATTASKLKSCLSGTSPSSDDESDDEDSAPVSLRDASGLQILAAESALKSSPASASAQQPCRVQ
jgi:hypothetical protein